MKNYWSKTTFFYLAVCWSIEAWILILCCQSEQEIQSKSEKKILWFQLMLNIRKYQPWWLFYSWIPLTVHYNLDKKIILKISINLSRIVTTFWIFCKSNFGIYKLILLLKIFKEFNKLKIENNPTFVQFHLPSPAHSSSI